MEKSINKKLMITAFISYLFIFIWVIVFKFNASWIEEVRIYELSQPYLERIGLEWNANKEKYFKIIKIIFDSPIK